MSYLCARCDKPIDGEAREVDVDTASGFAPTLHVHAELCHPDVPQQTAPSRLRA